VYSHWFMDCLGPLFPNQRVEFNYAIVLIDLYSRWPVAYPLRSQTAIHVCDALIQLFMQTGIASDPTISSENGSNVSAKLTAEFMKRMSCILRFSTPGHPQACGLVER